MCHIEREPVMVFDVEHAEQLLDWMTRLSKSVTQCVFRGQSQDKPLIPSLLRPRSVERTADAADDHKSIMEKMIDHECHEVASFVRACDRAGLHLPGDIFPLINYDDRREEIMSKWPDIRSNPWAEIIALAQHHGVWTRLLDFTTNPHVALYFAVSEVCREIRQKELTRDDCAGRKFVIWVVNCAYAEMSPVLNLVSASCARNRYLQAQEALFIAVNTQEANVKFDVSELITDHHSQIENEVVRNCWPIARKWSVSYTEAPMLLRLLVNSGVDRVRVEPSMKSFLAAREENRTLLNISERWHIPALDLARWRI